MDFCHSDNGKRDLNKSEVEIRDGKSSSNSRNAEKRKNDDVDCIAAKAQHCDRSSKKPKIKVDDNEEEEPWSYFEPLKMSWIVQETYYGVKELLRISREISKVSEPSSLTLKSRYPRPTMTDARDGNGLYDEDEEETDQRKEPDFPLRTMKALNEIENKLRDDDLYGSRLISYELLIFKEVSLQKDAQGLLSIILNNLLSVDIAAEFTYTGKAPFRSFKELRLCDIIKRAVKKKFPNTGDKIFSERIGAWLSGCKRKHSRI